MHASRSILFVYEEGHISLVEELLLENPRPLVVALDLWVSEAMRNKGIAHETLTKYEPPFQHSAEQFARTNTVAREWHRIPEMSFFTHQGVPIAESVEICFELYFGMLWRISESMSTVLDAHPACTEIIVPHSLKAVSWESSMTAHFEVRAFVDAASLLAEKRGIAVRTPGSAPTRSGVPRKLPMRHRLALWVLNICVGLFAPRRRIKAFVSDYWRYILPYATKMDDLELVLMDRSEMQYIPWLAIWKHRIRCIHPRDRITTRIRRLARERREYFAREWCAHARAAVEQHFNNLMEGNVPWSFAEPVFSYLVESFSERIICDIEALRKIYAAHNINHVLERASVSAQHHFFVLAQVAYTVGIPAIEVQHGNETLAPYSLYSRLKSGYLAAYGPCVRARMVRDHGYDPDRIRPVGSPRFDQYVPEKISTEERARRLREMGLDPSRPVVLYAALTEEWYLYPSYFTTLEEACVFEALRDVQKENPDIQYIFKFRPRYYSNKKRHYIERLFASGGVIGTDSGDLKSLFVISDALVTPRSTMMHEAVLQGLPVILYPVRGGDTPFVDFYRRGFPVLTSDEEFRRFMRELLPAREESFRAIYDRTRRFLDQEYAFDGHATERMISLLHEGLPPRPASDIKLPPTKSG